MWDVTYCLLLTWLSPWCITKHCPPTYWWLCSHVSCNSYKQPGFLSVRVVVYFMLGENTQPSLTLIFHTGSRLVCHEARSPQSSDRIQTEEFPPELVPVISLFVWEQWMQHTHTQTRTELHTWVVDRQLLSFSSTGEQPAGDWNKDISSNPYL